MLVGEGKIIFSSREALATVSNKENKIFTHQFIFYETYMLVSTENERSNCQMAIRSSARDQPQDELADN